MFVNPIPLCVTFLALLIGCSEAKPKLIPVNGRIEVNGKPISNISLQFLPNVDADATGVWPTSYGISNEDGSFELKTSDGELGAVPGNHFVILSDLEEERPPQGQPRTKPQRIGSEYAIAGKLTAVVEEGKSIELKIP